MIERLGAAIEAHCDLEALARARAKSAPDAARARRGRPGARAGRGTVRVAIARGPAFSFHYEENLELLRGRGRRAASSSTRCTDERCRRPTR